MRLKDDTIDLRELAGYENYLGSIIVVYSKGGNGPEGICADLFYDAACVADVPAKLRALADKLESEQK